MLVVVIGNNPQECQLLRLLTVIFASNSDRYNNDWNHWYLACQILVLRFAGNNGKIMGIFLVIENPKIGNDH